MPGDTLDKTGDPVRPGQPRLNNKLSAHSLPPAASAEIAVGHPGRRVRQRDQAKLG
jgi:hypothetical protein